MSEQSTVSSGNHGDNDLIRSIALFYAGGDESRAREMIEGKYRDLYVIKSVFKSASLSGALVIFYNCKHLKIVDTYPFITPGLLLRELTPDLNCWEFEKMVVDCVRSGEQDDILGRTIRDGIYRAFTMTLITDLNRALENEDDISINRLIRKIVLDSLGVQRIEIKVLFDYTTSLEMELKSLTTRKLDRNTLDTQKMDSAGQVRAVGDTTPSNVPKVGVDGVKMIINCGFILSPIKGKDINKLQPGDRIRISIIETSPKAQSVAKAFNAFDEQTKKFSPINARIKQIEKSERKGIEVYAVLAKGVIARISEEEDNIKVAMDPNYVWQAEEEPESRVNIAGLMVVMLIIAICTAVVIAVIKLL